MELVASVVTVIGCKPSAGSAAAPLDVVPLAASAPLDADIAPPDTLNTVLTTSRS